MFFVAFLHLEALVPICCKCMAKNMENSCQIYTFHVPQIHMGLEQHLYFS